MPAKKKGAKIQSTKRVKTEEDDSGLDIDKI